MRTISRQLVTITSATLCLALASAASDFYLSFDGPFLKSAPAQAGVQYTQNNVTTGGSAEFTADWTTGKVGAHCFVFSGSSNPDIMWNEWAKVNNHATVNLGQGDFSIEFWVKTADATANNTVLDKRLNGVGYHVTLYYGAPLLQLSTVAQGHANYYLSSAKVNDGHWHRVQFFVDRDKTDGGRLCIDGICVYTFNPTRYAGASLDNSQALWIGRHLYTPVYNFNGCLDDLRIWKN